MKKNILLWFFSTLFLNIWGQNPTEQMVSLNVSDTFAWKCKINIEFPSNVDSVLIFVSSNNSTNNLSDNKSYQIGEYVGTMKLAKKIRKNTNSFELLGLNANTTYFVHSITYNYDNGQYYCTESPKSISFKTKGLEKGNYYDGLDTQQQVFLTQLSAKLKNHTFASYDDFKKVIQEVYVQDTFIADTSSKYVVCDYSSLKAYYPIWHSFFSFPSTNFSREHTLPQSWMEFKTNLTNEPEGADYHNLALVEATVNSQRSNYPLGNVTTNVKTMGEAKYKDLPDQDPNSLFEPKDRYKGNVSRSIFYQMLCYNGEEGKNWGFQEDLLSFADKQDQEILKTWARQDKVDNFEIARHECIASLQGNRNPFIDFPDWIDCINFDIMKQLKTCEGLTISDTSKKPIDSPVHGSIHSPTSQWDIWYQMVGDDLIVHYYMGKISDVNIEIYDLMGRSIFSETNYSNVNENVIKIPTSELLRNTYILRLSYEDVSKSLIFIKEN